MAESIEQVAKEYVEEGWAHCPRCKSGQIEAGAFDFEGNVDTNICLCYNGL